MKNEKGRDKRNWKEYNNKLIKRGEFYINPRFLETWLNEIKEMNAGKVGNPYFYPNSMIEFSAILHEKGFDYRALEGILRALSRNLGNFPVISYSQICRRVNTLDLNFDKPFRENLVVGIDGSGNKVSNRGEWIRHKWKVRRGWIKIVIMGDTKGDIVDIRVGNENLDERASARGMLRKNKKKIKKAILDGLHDCEDTFDLCDKLGIEAVIKIRENALDKGFSSRAKEVRLYKNIGYKRWAKEKGYGLRWPASEGIFSAVKRIFGECVTATKKRNMYKQAKRKFWAYNKILEIT
ncbi:MAG: IS5 family transposase [Candidatus Aenigmarchaeota archaeon]|nr:IS5 family transposase [Candidatus Aenigmarchaeota archaeon]